MTDFNQVLDKIKNLINIIKIPIHIYKNLIKGAYDRNENYVKKSSTRKRKPKNI